MSPWIKCKSIAVLLIVPVIYQAVVAAERQESFAKEVVASGEAVVEQLTPEEARHMALRNARANGIEKALGVEVRSQTLVRDFSLLGDFIKTLSKGYILEEQVLNWEQKSYQESPTKPPLTSYRVTLRMRIVPSQGKRDPYFKLRATLNKNVFMEGEEATIKVTPTKKCYLTILNLTANDKVNILFPNLNQSNNLARAHADFVFPNGSFGLHMAPYPSHRRDTEAFILIASKQPIYLSTLLGKENDLPVHTLYKTLLNIPLTEWTEYILPYEVRKKTTNEY